MAQDNRRRRPRSWSRSRSREPARRSGGGRHRALDFSSYAEELRAQTALLPAAQHRDEVLEALAKHQAIVCVGETGSGKTTQLPQFLLASGKYDGGVIAVTQPRRVATVSVAHRVSEELGTNVGDRVGFAIRFETRCSSHTRIKFLTDGVLVRECLADPLLSQYSAVMLDEAHERSIHTDILLGLLKQLLPRRPDFRLLVTSATLDADRFAGFFGPPACPIVRIPGRVFPVDVLHSKQRQIMGLKGPRTTQYVRAAVETTMQIHNSEDEGHILVFLTGQHEITDACDQLRRLNREQQGEGDGKNRMKLLVLPLYGALHGRKQREIFAPVSSGTRKVIVATNIAETSLTIDGVRFVVDSGFTKQKVYDPARQMEALVIVPVSKVSAQQRAGRAGRTAPGKCFRLFDKASYDLMMEETVPEIRRANLANTVLYLKLLGIHDVLGFDYLDPPDEDALLDALKQLFQLGALDPKSGNPTALGKLMAAFPLEPKLSRALIEAMTHECGQEMAAIVAMLSTESVFVEQHQSTRGKKRSRNGDDDADDSDDDGPNWEQHLLSLKDDGLLDEFGDHLTYLNILTAFDDAAHRYRDRPRELEHWCDERRLRQRALTMAQSIRQQLDDIAATLPRRDLDQVASSTVPEDANKSTKPSLSTRLRKSCALETCLDVCDFAVRV